MWAIFSHTPRHGRHRIGGECTGRRRARIGSHGFAPLIGNERSPKPGGAGGSGASRGLARLHTEKSTGDRLMHEATTVGERSCGNPHPHSRPLDLASTDKRFCPHPSPSETSGECADLVACEHLEEAAPPDGLFLKSGFTGSSPPEPPNQGPSTRFASSGMHGPRVSGTCRPGW